eukprot:gnl/TRDRNA2_/TRDRNA2_182038_c0_seq1.p1 gnl/TRDRNA2_/TRDRNA2_182038_c0~~gnl/TRDRNA2_/TRDRNA2_182038_c0_seq1.p1  ORF type:complete len:225 (-),score=31.97 gnl/TRDRNA2_/TRDRNA2_182038_c0_seq1:158-832(-)
MRGALLVATLQLLLCSLGVHASRVRSFRGLSYALADNVTSRVRKSDLPEECDPCDGGTMDPFMGDEKYCNELLERCECCRTILEEKKDEICANFASYGKGDCVENIKAATDAKEEECKEQQKREDAAYQRKKQKARDAGAPLFHAVVSGDAVGVGANRTAKVGPYEGHCEGYDEPSCEDHYALCDHDAGCNRQLWLLENEYTRVKDYKGLYDNNPCFKGGASSR